MKKILLGLFLCANIMLAEKFTDMSMQKVAMEVMESKRDFYTVIQLVKHILKTEERGEFEKKRIGLKG